MTIKTHRLLNATALATILAVLLVALLTIIGEEYAPLKNWLKNTFSHHWLGKSELSIALFGVTTLLVYFIGKDTVSSVKMVWAALVATVLSAGAMCIFFALHLLHLV